MGFLQEIFFIKSCFLLRIGIHVSALANSICFWTSLSHVPLWELASLIPSLFLLESVEFVCTVHSLDLSRQFNCFSSSNSLINWRNFSILGCMRGCNWSRLGIHTLYLKGSRYIISLPVHVSEHDESSQKTSVQLCDRRQFDNSFITSWSKSKWEQGSLQQLREWEPQ